MNGVVRSVFGPQGYRAIPRGRCPSARFRQVCGGFRALDLPRTTRGATRQAELLSLGDSLPIYPSNRRGSRNSGAADAPRACPSPAGEFTGCFGQCRDWPISIVGGFSPDPAAASKSGLNRPRLHHSLRRIGYNLFEYFSCHRDSNGKLVSGGVL